MTNHEELLRYDDTFRYQLLSRMKQDCNYYLGYGSRSHRVLWAEDEKEQIEVMKDLWNSFEDDQKPEWLSWEDILEFEKEMIK